MDKGGDKEGDKRIQGKSQRGWKGPIGPGEIREDLVGWLCNKFDLWHSLAHHLADE